jgi:hypothetical protein
MVFWGQPLQDKINKLPWHTKEKKISSTKVVPSFDSGNFSAGDNFETASNRNE